MTRKLLTTIGVVGAAMMVLAGCSGTDDQDAGVDGRPTIVTSTNVWGSVARAVAGAEADVTSIYTGTDDPHEFEPSAADSATVADADVIVMNGGHYDAYMEEAAKSGRASTIDAFGIFENDEHGADEHGADHQGGGHDHGAMNEHVFYNLTVVGQVATRIAEELGKKSPAHATAFTDNAKKFNEGITGLRGSLTAIRNAHKGAKVAQTEPLAGYLLDEAGIIDAAPAGFTNAVEEGQSPSAADRAQMEDLLTTHAVRALVYNTQAVDPVTEALLGIAGTARVPVLRFTETLPEGIDDYVSWQRGQIDALSAALSAPAPK